MELAFSPSGKIIAVCPVAGPDATAPPAVEPKLRRVAEAFGSGQGAGLFLLATESFDRGLSPSLAFWRDFARKYLTALCHTPETSQLPLAPIAPPEPLELVNLVASAPPMLGAEYLSESALAAVWQDLDAWVRGEVAAHGQGLAEFLKQRAPLWHQVGRVCFHLAENRRDEDYPFAFLATYAPTITGSARVQYQPLSMALREFAGAENKPALVRLLAPVQRASDHSSLVKELLESGDLFHPLAWTPQQAYRFLKDVPAIKAAGVLVRVPDWWKKRPRPQVRVTIGESGRGKLAADALLDFRVDVALDGQPLSEAEWRQLLGCEDGLVQLRGQWVELDRQKLQEVLAHWRKIEQQAGDGLSLVEALRLLAGAPSDTSNQPDDGRDDRQWALVGAGQWLADLLSKLRCRQKLEDAATNGELKATLRPYQTVGVGWLRFVAGLGLGGCLADDMGLGKTVQVLALLAHIKNKNQGDRPSLLVMPASLLANWQAEMRRFTPSLRAVFAHPAETPREQLQRMAAAPAAALRDVDVVATSYGMLLRQPWLREVHWKLVVLDEAQAIKNPAARQTRAVKQLKADARLALTGTPVENRLSDLWSLFDFLCPGLLGSQTRFKQLVKQLQSDGRHGYAPLRNLVQPFILRRLKTDKRIIDDLPEKIEVPVYCGLSKRQAALYQRLVEQLARELQGLDGIKRRGAVLSCLMRLKQLCNHPSQLLGDGQFAPEHSGKFTRLAEICEEIASRQERALVFTQFREMTEPLAQLLCGVFGRPGLVLHGQTPVGKRQELVDRFQRDDGPPFFILSLKAGGTGLNLTAATHVVHFDRWWNPAVENQATDRAFRIGQKRNVLVHKFICRGTVEERIDKLIEDKRALAAELIDQGAEKLLTEMTDTELISFLTLDVARATL